MGLLGQKNYVSKKGNDIPSIIFNLLKRDKAIWTKKIEISKPKKSKSKDHIRKVKASTRSICINERISQSNIDHNRFFATLFVSHINHKSCLGLSCSLLRPSQWQHSRIQTLVRFLLMRHDPRIK